MNNQKNNTLQVAFVVGLVAVIASVSTILVTRTNVSERNNTANLPEDCVKYDLNKDGFLDEDDKTYFWERCSNRSLVCDEIYNFLDLNKDLSSDMKDYGLLKIKLNSWINKGTCL